MKKVKVHHLKPDGHFQEICFINMSVAQALRNAANFMLGYLSRPINWKIEETERTYSVNAGQHAFFITKVWVQSHGLEIGLENEERKVTDMV